MLALLRDCPTANIVVVRSVSRSWISRTGTSIHAHAVIRYVAHRTQRTCSMETRLTSSPVQVCQFCFNNIKNNMNGLCPACRRPYDEKTIQWKVVTQEEYVELSQLRRKVSTALTTFAELPSSEPKYRIIRSGEQPSNGKKKCRNVRPKRTTGRIWWAYASSRRTLFM